MRIKATILLAFKAISVQWKQILLIYAILPLILALILGFVQKDLYRPNTHREKINITIIDNDNSISSRNLKSIFTEGSLKKLFKTTSKGDYVITIPKGYDSNINKFKSTTIQVEEKNRASISDELTINSIINQYSRNISQASVLSEHQDLYKEIFNKNAIKVNKIHANRILTSFENQAASLMSFMLFIMAIGCVAGYHLDKENGAVKRIMSTPVTKVAFFNLEMLLFFVCNLIYGLVYIAVFLVTGMAFRDANPITLFSILVVQSLLIASIAGFMITYLSKSNSNILIIIFMYFQILFGGGFISLRMTVSRIYKTLTNFAPGNVITQCYKNCIVHNSFLTIEKLLLIMLLTTVIFYSLSIIKVKIRWEA